MKKFILVAALLTLPVIAEEINMTPQNTYSGYYNKSNIRTNYPYYKRPISNNYVQQDRSDIMKPRSVHDMGDVNPSNDGKSPMTYSQFPQNYDSSNMLHMQGVQNGMQNMFMGY